jgi:hypothetical protein
MITEDILLQNGFEKRVFFFAIGSGEDEDDIDIFVKDGIAVTYESTYDCWFANKEENINYTNGFPISDSVAVETIEELKQLTF